MANSCVLLEVTPGLSQATVVNGLLIAILIERARISFAMFSFISPLVLFINSRCVLNLCISKIGELLGLVINLYEHRWGVWRGTAADIRHVLVAASVPALVRM